MNILLIERNPAVSMKLGDYLEAHGNVVDYAASAELAIQLARTHHFDAIVLAARVGRKDGFELCSQLRDSVRKPPVILLVGDDVSLGATVAAFEAGADDYMARPVALAEVRARLIALARRARAGQSGGGVLRVGDLELDLSLMEARRAGNRIALTPTEFKLLRILMESAPNVVTYAELDACLWGADRELISDTNLRAQVYKLRLVIDRPYPIGLIETRRNIGYRIVPPETPSRRRASFANNAHGAQLE